MPDDRMLQCLARALADAGQAAAPDELRDMLWLAARCPGVALHAVRSGADATKAGAGGGGSQTQGGDAGRVSLQEQQSFPVIADDNTDLSAKTDDGQVPAKGVQVRGVWAVPEPHQLRQALRPFRRRVVSTAQCVLDEEASAERWAELGSWVPVQKAQRERWFDLQLVVDTGVSMDLWQAEIESLTRSLRAQGGFRSIQRFLLAGTGQAQLFRSERGAPLQPTALAQPGRRPLVLLVTDGGAPRWDSGAGQRWLWATGALAPVALQYLLPDQALRHSTFGQPQGKVWWTAPGLPNTRLCNDLDELEAPAKGWRGIPVLGLDAASVADWARGATAKGGATLPATWVGPYHPAATPPAAANATQERRIAAYRQRVSPTAYELAVFFSAVDPLTVPVMRLVQRAMLPDSGTSDLAEVFLGGLLEPVAVDGGEPNWRFPPGVREVLHASLRYSEKIQIDAQLGRVGELLEADQPGPMIEAMFPSPVGPARQAKWALPFASVSRRILAQARTAARIPRAVGPRSAARVPGAPSVVPREPNAMQSRGSLQQAALPEPAAAAQSVAGPYAAGPRRGVFVSYAHVDDEPVVGGAARGWVSRFVNQLQIAVAQRSGRDIELWMNHQLESHHLIEEETRRRLSESAALLVFMSPSYLSSDWCSREMATFVEGLGVDGAVRRIVIVEMWPTERRVWHPASQDLLAFRLWAEDAGSGAPRLMGWPIPDPHGDRPYWEAVSDLANLLARAAVQPPTPFVVPPRSPDVQPLPMSAATEDEPLNIVIHAAADEDKALVSATQALLAELGVDAYLVPRPSPGQTPAQHRALVEQLVRESDGVLVIHGRAPASWVQAKLAELRKLLALERRGTWIGLLEGPPGSNPVQGLSPRGVMTLDCSAALSRDELNRFAQSLRQQRDGSTSHV